MQITKIWTAIHLRVSKKGSSCFRNFRFFKIDYSTHIKERKLKREFGKPPRLIQRNQYNPWQKWHCKINPQRLKQKGISKVRIICHRTYRRVIVTAERSYRGCRKRMVLIMKWLVSYLYMHIHEHAIGQIFYMSQKIRTKIFQTLKRKMESFKMKIKAQMWWRDEILQGKKFYRCYMHIHQSQKVIQLEKGGNAKLRKNTTWWIWRSREIFPHTILCKVWTLSALHRHFWVALSEGRKFQPLFCTSYFWDLFEN